MVASQFPLWMRASSIAAEVLYSGLLCRRRPALGAARRCASGLRTDVPETHDWASIVAYATIAPDLEAQVEAFRDRQVRLALEVGFARIDDLAAAGVQARAGAAAEMERLCASIRSDLRRAGAPRRPRSPTRRCVPSAWA